MGKLFELLIFGLVVTFCVKNTINAIDSMIRKRRMREIFELKKNIYEDFFNRVGITMPSLANSIRRKSVSVIGWYFLIITFEIILLVFIVKKIGGFERLTDIVGLLKLF